MYLLDLPNQQGHWEQSWGLALSQPPRVRRCVVTTTHRASDPLAACVCVGGGVSVLAGGLVCGATPAGLADGLAVVARGRCSAATTRGCNAKSSHVAR